MKIQQILSKPKLGMKKNQDCVGVSKNKSGIWVIDGITEIIPTQLTNGENAVSWYVNQISEYLAQSLDQIDLTIIEILAHAIKDIREEFKSLTATDFGLLKPYEHPSASIIIARNIQDRELELFSLGDCVAYVHASNQEYLVQNYELKKAEEQFQTEIFRKRKKYPELTHSEFLKEIKISWLLKQLRNELTQNNQYHILNLNPTMASKGHKSYFHSIKTVFKI